ncbi:MULTISPECIES: MmcQ/YjbR family DNA-binding protein [unclassified Agarivorans]|uniref:MmcQ/YjbR family DNA-binding protein n=1 Tax=unclassified Agarivorans TaxID=2636026 RepID=UPI003D7CCC69
MDYKELREYLLSKPEAELDLPFAPDVPVFKVRKKMFALVGWKNELMSINLKCQPEQIDALLDIYPSITRGYHMNKRHWISLYFDGGDAEHEVFRLIDNSYELVVRGMSRNVQTLLIGLADE